MVAGLPLLFTDHVILGVGVGGRMPAFTDVVWSRLYTSPTRQFLTPPLIVAALDHPGSGTVTAVSQFRVPLTLGRLNSAPDGAFDLSSVRFLAHGFRPI